MVVDIFGKELSVGDEVITIERNFTLFKAKIIRINEGKSLWYIRFNESTGDYDTNNRSWKLVYYDKRQRDMYKI